MTYAPAAQASAVTCPQCHGPMWDERKGKYWGNGLSQSGKPKPTHKCRNKECGGALWLKEAPTPTTTPVVQPTPAPAVSTPTKQPVSIGLTGDASLDRDVDGWAALRAKYGECFTYVMDNVVPVLDAAKIGASPEAIAAATATLFIARQNKNA